MSWKYIFRKKAIKSFSKLDKKIQERIIKKLDFYFASENPLQYAERLTDPKIWTYRFRIWEYRLVFDIDEEGKLIILLVIDVRWSVYKEV